MSRNVEIKWRPQPRQMTFFKAMGLQHAFDGGTPQPPLAKLIGYGGAAGGGKSDALVMASIIFCMTFPNSNVGYFRLRYVQLAGPGGPIMRATELLAPLVRAKLCKWNGTDSKFTFWNGSIIKFGNLENYHQVVNDYQGLQFDFVAFDEATHQTWDKVSYLLGRLRATNDNVIRPFMALATNPGGIGHSWYKRIFVDSGEPEEVREVTLEEDGKEKAEVMFIPAKLSDNKILMDRDPDYERNLRLLPEVLQRQLLDGDWDIIDGVAFNEFRRSIHVCKPFEIPKDWTRFTSADWGYAKPYAVGWYAIDFDGRLYKYRELYGWGGKPDVGSRVDPEDVAKKMLEIEREAGENIRFRVIDDAVFGSKQDNSPSIGEQFARAGVYWQPVGKGKGSRISGKLEMHYRLKVPDDYDPYKPETHPMLIFFETCVHTVRTIPVLLLDENNPEDVDTDMEDHAYDETRYACMSRPMASKRKKPEESRQLRHKKRIINSAQRNRRVL